MGHMHHPDHRLTPLKPSQLQFPYPTGPRPGDDPGKRRVPDSVLLNRHEWYEVLYFVNKFANTHGNGNQAVALKAERLIRRHLPGHIRGHQNVEQWLLQNWEVYSNA